MLSENAFKEMPTLADKSSDFRFSSGIQVYFWTQRVYCEAVGRHGIITDMDTILVFSTSIGRAHADMLAGVREFAKDADWNVQSFVYDGELPGR